MEERGWAGAAPPRRPWALLAGVLALVAAVGWLSGLQLQEQDGLQVVTAATPTTPATVGPGPAQDPHGSWRTLDAPALALRTEHTATWTGERVLVFGGRPDPGAARFVAFDPRDGSVDVLPPGPLGGRADHSAVWTGRELVVIGGARARPSPTSSHAPAPAQASVGIYDPATRRWRAVTQDPGIALALPRVAVWTGEAIVVVGQAPRGGLPVAARLDPATATWRPLPEPPLGSFPAAIGVWAGAAAEVLVWSGQPGGPAAALDPARGAWRALGASPRDVRPFVEPAALWDGGRMLLLGRTFGGQAPPLLLSLTPGGTWQRLPDSPLSSASTYDAVWTGEELVLVGGRRDEPGATFGRSGVWEALAPAPVAPIAGHTTTWTGSQVVVVGGAALDGAALPPAVFTPA